MINLRDIYREVKFGFQRMFRGYSDTFYWEMDTYLNYYFIPAIKKFCERRIKECGDERFLKVYKEMLEKIDKWEKADYDDWHKCPSANSEMWSYFGNNIEYFWD